MLKKLFSKKTVSKPEQKPQISVSEIFQAAMQCHQAGDFSQAEMLYRQILQADPNHVDALHYMGVLAYQLGQYESAVELISQAIRVHPTASPMYCNLGLALQELGKLEAAVENYRKALELRPQYSEAYYNLGNALRSQGKLDDAIENYRLAFAAKPDYAQAHSNLGIVFQAQGKIDLAIASYRCAIEFKPDYAQAHYNLGLALQTQRKIDLAIASCHRALLLNSDYAEARCTLGFLLLSVGQFNEGWQHCEARYSENIKHRSSFIPNLPFPQWQGGSINGKSLLVWFEQGLGDEIQFCRYVSVLKSLGARHVTWVCKKPLKALFKTLKFVDSVFSPEEANLIAFHDYWTFPLSLPLHCKTTLDNIPATVPYLYANPELVKNIACELISVSEFKVGLCWKGSSAHTDDANRSPGTTAFKSLFEMSGVKFFTLQPDTREEFIQAAGKKGVDRGNEIDQSSFEEAAALIMNLDLVITCDTSICHLAGALGKPVWIVLPFAADWRWLIEREDSPWYPNIRLFRQSKPGNWGEVFQRVEQQLQEVIPKKPQMIASVL